MEGPVEELNRSKVETMELLVRRDYMRQKVLKGNLPATSW